MKKITILKDEYWWAADVSMGIHMPFDAKSIITIDLGGDESQNPKNPLLLSSKGRYVWDELPFCAVVLTLIEMLKFVTDTKI